MNAALGTRSYPEERTYCLPPEVQKPETCPIRERFSTVTDSLDSRIEQRWALPLGAKEPTEIEPGRIAVWSRMPELWSHQQLHLLCWVTMYPWVSALYRREKQVNKPR